MGCACLIDPARRVLLGTLSAAIGIGVVTIAGTAADRSSRELLVAHEAMRNERIDTSERGQVQDKVKQFLHATSAKDSKTLCEQVLAPSLVGRLSAGGITCMKAMQIFVSSVHSPTLSIGPINIKGQTASAITLTTAKGDRKSVV